MSIPKIFEKAIAATNDATEWCELQTGEMCSVSIPSGITGTVNFQRSFDGGTTVHNLSNEAGTSNFAAGAQLDYIATSAQVVRIKGTLVSSGSATVQIKRG